MGDVQVQSPAMDKALEDGLKELYRRFDVIGENKGVQNTLVDGYTDLNQRMGEAREGLLSVPREYAGKLERLRAKQQEIAGQEKTYSADSGPAEQGYIAPGEVQVQGQRTDEQELTMQPTDTGFQYWREVGVGCGFALAIGTAVLLGRAYRARNRTPAPNLTVGPVEPTQDGLGDGQIIIDEDHQQGGGN